MDIFPMVDGEQNKITLKRLFASLCFKIYIYMKTNIYLLIYIISKYILLSNSMEASMQLNIYKN